MRKHNTVSNFLKRCTLSSVIAISVTILTLAPSVVAQGNSPRDSVRLFLQRGGQELQAKNYTAAKKSFQRALEIDSLDLNALRNLGFILSNENKDKEAISYWERAVRHNVADADLYNNLGVGYGKLGEIDKSSASYERAIEMSPGSSDYVRNYGSTLLNASKYKEALELLQPAVKKHKLIAELHYLLGNAFAGTGDPVGAQRGFRKAIELDYDNAELRHNLGMALEFGGDLWGAEEEYGKASGMAPENLDYRQRLAVFYLRTSVVDQSIKMFRENLRRDSSYVNSRIGLAAAYAYLEMTDSMKAEVIRIEKTAPDRVEDMKSMIKMVREFKKMQDSAKAANQSGG